MNRMEDELEELKRSFQENRYPAGFLQKYDQLECLANGHGTETFLVLKKNDGSLYIAKCYDKAVYSSVSENGILTRLSHSGLPAYSETFESDRVCVTVREYVEGTPLDRYAAENKVSQRQAVSFCIQLCEILTYLHRREKPVIHRDIKPQNIIVRGDGSIVLIDFDIARQYRRDAESDTQFFGTRVYAPPEQYGFAQTDCRADIYSLGVLLRFLLTGSEKECPDVSLPGPMKRIIRRCTAFSPKDRFTNAVAVKKALLKADDQYRRRVAARIALAATAVTFLCGGFVIGRYTKVFTLPDSSGAVVFQEPLIEAAARAQLGKEAGEPLLAEELESVRALYLFGTEVSATRATFEKGLAEVGRYTRGGVRTLDDLAWMPNIEELQISYQTLEDASGVAALKNPVSVILMYTRVKDISALSGKQSLISLNLYGTDVSDVTCLDSCERLEYLELGRTLVSSLDHMGGGESVTQLSLTGLKLDSLSGIERYPYLKTLNLSDAGVGSLEALKNLSELKEIQANGELYEKLTEMFDGTNVSIVEP